MPEAVQPTTEPTQAAPPQVEEPTLEELAAKLFKPEEPEASASTEQATEAPAEPEKTEEPAKDPAAERTAARLAAATRAERRAQEARAELRSQQQQMESRQRELDAREQRLKLIEDDPVKFFEEFKADPKTFLEKLAGEYKPENVVAKKVDVLEKQLAEERAERARLQAEREKREKSAEAEAAWKEASGAFVSFVVESAERFPHLVEEFTEQQATEEAFAALTEVVHRDEKGDPITRAEAYRMQYGDYPDNATVAEYLNAIAKQRIENRQKAAWRKRGESAANPGQGVINGDPKPASPVTGARPRTLTSRESSTRAAAPKPWSQEAADEESLRILQAALAKS